MAAPAAGKRKRDFCEDDAYLILHPDKHGYTPATILTALQEVAQHAGRRRVDWTALVAKTATGIKSAREYQMLWRYLAYGHHFVDDTAQPLDDESDLECEIEPFPTPSSQAAAEASRCAKILIYGSSREQVSSHRVNSEVPLLNTPNGKITRLPFDKQLCQSHPLTNGAGPVSNLKQASRTGLSPDPFDGNGPQKKKRKPKPWSKEEDADLMTGVHKCGEGNWLDILHKYSFDNTRSAAELSQRWALISKRQGTTKPAHAKQVSAKIDMAATHNALYMAVGKTGLSTLRRSVFGTTTPEVKSAVASSSFSVPVPVPVPLQVQMPLRQVQQAPDPAGLSNTSNKSRINQKKKVAQTNTTNGPSLIQAAAIAAGGRIATQSVATKLMKAAQSTKAVRVRSRGTGSSKTSSSSKSSTMAGESGARLGSDQHPEHPKCSALTSSPLVLTTQSAEQVNAVPEVTGVNPLEQSASAHLLETERRMSTTPVSGPCDNTAMDDEVTMEDLFPEDVKQSDIVDPKADQEIMHTRDADILDQFDRFVESQQKQSKELPTVGKIIPVSARAPAAVKKAKTLGSTFPPAVTPSGIVGTGNAGVLSKALRGQPSGPRTTGEQNRCQEIMAQTQHARNSKSNVLAKNAAPGTRTPTRNAPPGVGAPAGNPAPDAGTAARNPAPGAGTAARNAAPGAGAPARNVAPGTGPRPIATITHW
ncbi:unnamed protein product [Alopecurus aequalis]